MINLSYKNQVKLLLDVLPEVAKENCFALHGGTAINLFIRNLERISVDIDLTYVPIENRDDSLKNIAEALQRIKSRLEKRIPLILVEHKRNKGKLLISKQRTQIKLEVNLVGRGTFLPPSKMPVCNKVQEKFDVFCTMPIVSKGQLFGGKICAALDRQHPRDLFDIKYLLTNEGFTEEIKVGFLLCLLSSDRPIHEILAPRLQDQRLTMQNQFTGMTLEPFTYEDFEKTRESLKDIIQQSLTLKDKTFLMTFQNLKPDWSVYNFKAFPAVRWKLQNLKKLEKNNLQKYQKQSNLLENILGLFDR